MIKLLTKMFRTFLKKENKFKYDPVNNSDSMLQRYQAKRKVATSNDEEIRKRLGLEDEGPQPSKNKGSLSMMDIVMQTWGVDSEDAKEEENE